MENQNKEQDGRTERIKELVELLNRPIAEAFRHPPYLPVHPLGQDHAETIPSGSPDFAFSRRHIQVFQINPGCHPF